MGSWIVNSYVFKKIYFQFMVHGSLKITRKIKKQIVIDHASIIRIYAYTHMHLYNGYS